MYGGGFLFFGLTIHQISRPSKSRVVIGWVGLKANSVFCFGPNIGLLTGDLGKAEQYVLGNLFYVRKLFDHKNFV